MFLKRGFERLGKHRHSVFGAFSVADEDFVAREIYVLDAEGKAFHESESCAVHEAGGEAFVVLEKGDDGADFVAAHDDGKMQGLFRADDLAEFVEWAFEDESIEEDDSCKSLILGRGAHFDIDGESCQECVDVGFGEGTRVAALVILKKSFEPHEVGVAGTRAVMFGFEHFKGFLSERGDGRRP